LVHLLEARAKIEKLGHAAQPLADILQIWRDPDHLLEIAVGIDVAIDVDYRAHVFPPASFCSTRCRCSGSACQLKRSAMKPQSPLGAQSMATMATVPIISK